MLTPERLAELRRVAEAATPGPWHQDRLDPELIKNEDGDRVFEASHEADEIAANVIYVVEFDPSTVLAMLYEIERLRAENAHIISDIRLITAPIEVGGGADAYLRCEVDRLRREHETLAGGLREAEIVLADWCSVDRSDPESTIHDKAPKFVKALALLDGEKGGDRRE